MHKHSCPPFQSDDEKGADKLEKELQAISFGGFSPVYNVSCPCDNQVFHIACNTRLWWLRPHEFCKHFVSAARASESIEPFHARHGYSRLKITPRAGRFLQLLELDKPWRLVYTLAFYFMAERQLWQNCHEWSKGEMGRDIWEWRGTPKRFGYLRCGKRYNSIRDLQKECKADYRGIWED